MEYKKLEAKELTKMVDAAKKAVSELCDIICDLSCELKQDYELYCRETGYEKYEDILYEYIRITEKYIREEI
jgi:hypothetical protein